jgi:predicted kinase
MAEVHLVFGPQGAGKSTYSRELANATNGVRFSIDDWMQQLYGADLQQPLDLRWIMERVKRCEVQIWRTAQDVAKSGGNVVLDLGFMKAQSRAEFESLAVQIGSSPTLHYLTAAREIRLSRVMMRNTAKDRTFSFEVTQAMFDAMEREFETPDEAEMARAVVLHTHAAA